MSRVRLYRFAKWYRRLRRNPVDFQLPRWFALKIAWYWSSDIEAFRARSEEP